MLQEANPSDPKPNLVAHAVKDFSTVKDRFKKDKTYVHEVEYICSKEHIPVIERLELGQESGDHEGQAYFIHYDLEYQTNMDIDVGFNDSDSDYCEKVRMEAKILIDVESGDLTNVLAWVLLVYLDEDGDFQTVECDDFQDDDFPPEFKDLTDLFISILKTQ